MAVHKWTRALKYMECSSSVWSKLGSRTQSQQAATLREDTRQKPTKPFSSIPSPKGLPFIGIALDYMRHNRKEPYTFHKFLDDLLKKHGPIMKMNVGFMEQVFLQNPDDIQEVLKHEGKYPSRFQFEAWQMYRKDRGLSTSVFLSEGEEWQKHRSALNHHMMRPHSVVRHIEDFREVAKDLIQYLGKELKVNGNGRVRDIRQCFFLWSLESGSTVVYEKRLGCLSEDPPEEVKMFIDGVQNTLATSEKLLMFPPKIARALKLPMWTEHIQHFDNAFQSGRKLAWDKIQEVRADMAAGKEVSGLIGSMLQHGGLSEDDVICNILDVTGGSVDTTSLCSLYTLYLLAKNPEKQQKLFAEIQEVKATCGSDGKAEIRNMSYMKAVIKESLRLFPVAPLNSRVLPEDVTIDGYLIPKGKAITIPLWTMGRDPNVYSDPESFRPERWLRDGEELDKIHPFAHLNFGHGPRACIGRRVAEYEMYIMLSELLQKYEILDGAPGEDLQTETKLVLLPKGHVPVVFRDRNA